jgi:peptidyl-prolyl isomerase E (cyclophilin E)
METTTVLKSGKGSNPKTVLYVGGLEDSVTELTLRSAFLPFGPIKECNIPLDNETGKHRGFGFVQYEDREDAADAIDNMHNGELFGRLARSAD